MKPVIFILSLLLLSACDDSERKANAELVKDTIIGDELQVKEDVEQLEEVLQKSVDELQDRIDEQIE